MIEAFRGDEFGGDRAIQGWRLGGDRGS